MRLVYDLTIQPFSVGDMLTHQAVAVVMGLDETIILYDEHHKMVPQLGGINAMQALPWLMDAARANGRCRSVEVVMKGFHRPLGSDWPHSDHYTTYECWRLLSEHHAGTGEVPTIIPRVETLKWANEYLERNGRVTVQVRRNPHNPKRDSDYGEWSRFLGNHRNEKFVLICSEKERSPTLECFGNVTWAECDMEKKLALVWAADFHLGMASGPVQMRWYGNRPFSEFKESVDPNRVFGMSMENGMRKMPWMNDGQRMIESADRYDRIEAEYAFHRDRLGRQARLGDRADPCRPGRHADEHTEQHQLPYFRPPIQGFA